MRHIKFRGMAFNGQIIYGSLLLDDVASIVTKAESASVDIGSHVFDDSVAQLVGVDKLGAEIYEGDILLDELEQEHVAEIYDRPAFLATLTLKP